MAQPLTYIYIPRSQHSDVVQGVGLECSMKIELSKEVVKFRIVSGPYKPLNFQRGCSCSLRVIQIKVISKQAILMPDNVLLGVGNSEAGALRRGQR